jgi:hypothetical protein
VKKRPPILIAPDFLLRFRKRILSIVPMVELGDLRKFLEFRVSVRSSRRWAAHPANASKREEFEVADL